MTDRPQGGGYARYFSPLDVWAIAFGCIVGWGAFVMPGTTFLPLAGPAGTLIGLAVGAALMAVIGVNYAYLMNQRPGTGGVYAYTKEAFGRDHAFLCSWFLCLSYLTIVFLNGTSLFVVIRTTFGRLLQRGYRYTIAGNDIYLGEVAASVVALGAVGLLFIKAKPLLQKLHTVLSLVLAVGALALTALCLPHLSAASFTSPFGTRGVGAFSGVFTIVLLAPWAFVGFDVISLETSHFEFPMKLSRRIIWLSIAVSALVYIGMTITSLVAAPEGYAGWEAYLADLGSNEGVASVPVFYAARTLLGVPGLAVMAVTAVAAILTGMIGAYRATTRMLSTMAEDHILSERFSATTYSILFIMVISIVISILGRNALEWFVDLTSFGAIVGFGYTSAAAWKMARTEGRRAVTITGALGTVISVVFVVVQLIPRLTALEAMGAQAYLLLALWCLLGFVFYWRTVTGSTLSDYSGVSTSGVVLFSLVLYSALMWLGKRVSAAETLEIARHRVAAEGAVMLLIVFAGLIIMLYLQNLIRKKHEALERERIRAVESSLAKSQFLFNMSHDIRTPMNAIIGYTNLARKANPPEEIADYLTKIDTSSQQLLSLINDILEMSRIESGKLEMEYAPADLCAIVTEAGDLFAEQMREKHLDFSVHLTQVRHRFVWCDRKNLGRVMMNVIGNAYKFTPEGGAVSVSAWEIFTGDEDQASYELRVRDSGIGMSPEFAERMFNAFERERTSTDSGMQGTGLGLSITKRIIDEMGGTIEVITSPGAGTEFIIRVKFRLANEADVIQEAPAEAAPQEDEPPVDFSKKRLLLVEDNDINREIAAMILTQAGFTLEFAVNGQEAVDKVAAAPEDWFDAVLMDIQMPVMDGYEATRTIRAMDDARRASLPIVAMTANAFKEDERAAEEAGMQAHIAKPLDVPTMMQTLTNVLRDAERRQR